MQLPTVVSGIAGTINTFASGRQNVCIAWLAGIICKGTTITCSRGRAKAQLVGIKLLGSHTEDSNINQQATHFPVFVAQISLPSKT